MPGCIWVNLTGLRFPDGMLAEVLPMEQVFTVEGGHDWPTWRGLWEEILKENQRWRKSREWLENDKSKP